jgi:hypothetical protein
MSLISILTPALSSLLGVGVDSWKDNKQFRTLQLIAYERICRELFWNRECLSQKDSKHEPVYFGMLRTDAFDELVNAGVPLDEIFSEPIHALMPRVNDSKRLPSLVLKRVAKDEFHSRLMDRTYNRIWMLKHRVGKDLPLGSLVYLRQLVGLTYDELERSRKALAGN